MNCDKRENFCARALVTSRILLTLSSYCNVRDVTSSLAGESAVRVVRVHFGTELCTDPGGR